MDDSNFMALDFVLERVKRKTVAEVLEERRGWGSFAYVVAEATDDVDIKLEPGDELIADDFQWDEWVSPDAEGELEVREEDVYGDDTLVGS